MKHLRCALGLLAWGLSALALACPALDVQLVQQEPDIWVRPGQAHDPAGWTEPVVVWVGASVIWVADPGPHRCAGLALRRELQKRWPGRSHRLINSHAHPRNVLANSAWPAGTPIHALQRVRQEMTRRCPACLESLQAELGPVWMQGTRIVVPNRIWQPGQTVWLGHSRWQVVAAEPAHTESDLMLRQPLRKLWWMPSALAWQEVPDMARANGLAWRQLVGHLQSLQGWRMLGASSVQEANVRLDWTGHYLQAMGQLLGKAQKEGRNQHEFYGWFEGLPNPEPSEHGLRQHQINVQKVWRDLEDAEDPRPGSSPR